MGSLILSKRSPPSAADTIQNVEFTTMSERAFGRKKEQRLRQLRVCARARESGRG